MKTENSDFSFTMPDDRQNTRLVAIGVGGMGNNAMENLARAAVPGLELYSLNTDVQALRRCSGSKPVQLGAKRTGGKGAGGNSEIGRMSAEDDLGKIRRLVAGAELVFIVAGMGGGTGSGAASVVARVCRELGVLSVCTVTMPMECEGPRRGEKAGVGLSELRKNVDSLLIIENEKLSTVMEEGDVSIIEVLRKADKVVVDTVAAIARVIHSHGYINLDLADLKNVLQRRDRGENVEVFIGLGVAAGLDRARKASEMALSNPLLRTTSIQGAANLLVNVAGSDQLGDREAMSVVKLITERVGVDSQEVFIGIVTDNEMGDRISVTVIATGLPLPGTAVVKIKGTLDDPARAERLGKGGGLVAISDIPINGICSENSVAEVICADNETCSYGADAAWLSPVVSKDEWRTPAYARAKIKAPHSGERMVGRLIDRKNQQPQADDFVPNDFVDEKQCGQPLFRMAG